MANWHSSVEEIDRVLAEQNPWHRDGAVPRVLAPPVERALARTLWGQVVTDDPRRFHLVLGPRRVGKTTVMYQTVRHLIEAGRSGCGGYGWIILSFCASRWETSCATS